MKELVSEISPNSSPNKKRTPVYSLDKYEKESSFQTSGFPSGKEPTEESDINQDEGEQLFLNIKKETIRNKKNIFGNVLKQVVILYFYLQLLQTTKNFSIKTYPSNLQYHLENFHYSKMTSRFDESRNFFNFSAKNI